jgi:hypothetical protein
VGQVHRQDAAEAAGGLCASKRSRDRHAAVSSFFRSCLCQRVVRSSCCWTYSCSWPLALRTSGRGSSGRWAEEPGNCAGHLQADYIHKLRGR